MASSVRCPEPGSYFGRYRILEPIASGGMAHVWLAEVEGAEGFKKKMVLKTVLPHLSENKSIVSMFIDEATVAARLDHENVVRVFDFGCVDDQYFIAMEYIVGRTLRQLVTRSKKRGTPIDTWFLLRVVANVCDALDYVHGYSEDGLPLGLLHRDVSPENIMISFTGAVKLLDFGVAHAHGATNTGLVVGRYRYMAPERLDGRPGIKTSDLYSLGVILYELLSGTIPFRGDDDIAIVKEILAGVPPLSWIKPELDPRLTAIVDRAMAPQEIDRYESAAAMGRDIRRFLSRSDRKAMHRSLAPTLAAIFDDAEDLPDHVREHVDAIDDDLEEFDVPPDSIPPSSSSIRDFLPRAAPSAPPPSGSSIRPSTRIAALLETRREEGPPSRYPSDVFSATGPASERPTPGNPFSMWHLTEEQRANESTSTPAPPPPARKRRERADDEGSAPPSDAAVSFERGLEELEDKNYSEALRHWQRAMELAPENRLYRANVNRLTERLRSTEWPPARKQAREEPESVGSLAISKKTL